MVADVESINIKNGTYYFLDDMINLNNVDSNSLKMDKKLHKHIDIYYIGYITIKKFSDYKNIHSINPLYLIIHFCYRPFKKTKILNSWFDRHIWRSLVWN